LKTKLGPGLRRGDEYSHPHAQLAPGQGHLPPHELAPVRVPPHARLAQRRRFIHE